MYSIRHMEKYDSIHNILFGINAYLNCEQDCCLIENIYELKYTVKSKVNQMCCAVKRAENEIYTQICNQKGGSHVIKYVHKHSKENEQSAV